MKKTFLFLFFCGLTASVCAQTTVVDPTSVAQRLSLFLEQMDEAVSHRFALLDEVANTSETLQLARDARQKLQEVSQFVKASSYSLDIVDYGSKIAGKIKDYKQEIAQLEHVTDEEKYNIVMNMLQLASYAAEKVKEGVQLTKSNRSKAEAEMSDYERIQVLCRIRGELDELNAQLDQVLSMALSANASRALSQGIESITFDAITFSFKK